MKYTKEKLFVVISDCFDRIDLSSLDIEPSLIILIIENIVHLVSKENILISTKNPCLTEHIKLNKIQIYFHENLFQIPHAFLPPDIPSIVNDLKIRAKTDCHILLLSSLTPFISGKTLSKALKTYFVERKQPLMSLSIAKDHPLLSMYQTKNGNFDIYYQLDKEYNRRQEFPLVYEPNNAFFIFRSNEYISFDQNVLQKKVYGFITENVESFNIQTELDLLLARKIFRVIKKHKLISYHDIIAHFENNIPPATNYKTGTIPSNSLPIPNINFSLKESIQTT